MFNLYVFENLTHKEIAYNLGISEGTSKSNLSKAKAKLKQNIIWVTQKAIDKTENELRTTVFHELLHAIYGCNHVRNCPIMSASQYIPVDKTRAIEIFRKYYNKYN